MRVSFQLNGRNTTLDVDPASRLLDVVRDDLGLTGTKEGCGEGECGACTVLLDGRPVNSCLIPAPHVDGHDVVTVEGLGGSATLHPIQSAFVDAGAVQCGFCTPGFIMSTAALLLDHPSPTDEEILTALEGNLCRCTGYAKILKAVHLAAVRLREKT
ncbi:MAG: (2Fe-2S)-binding protein [Candidatus Bipolaricaulota bacterium]